MLTCSESQATSRTHQSRWALPASQVPPSPAADAASQCAALVPGATSAVPRSRRSLVALVLTAAAVSTASVAGCGPRAGRAAPQHAVGENRSPQPEAHHGPLPHPDLLRFVPAETPYLYAVLEPLPADRAGDELIQRLAAYAPLAPRIADLARTHPGAYQNDLGFLPRLAAGLTDALGGPVTARRLQSVGLDPATRLVIYGFLAMPVVRIELSDSGRFAPFLDRVASQMGGRPHAVDGRQYWAVTAGNMTVLLAATDRHLIAAVLPSEPTPFIVRNVLSVDPPVHNLANDPRLEQVAADLDLSPVGIGWLDLQAMVETAALGLPPACRSELGALAKRVPRAVFGVREASKRGMSVVSRLDLAPSLAASLAALLSDVPGNDPRSTVPAALSVSVAIDLPGALTNLADALARVQAAPYRCPALSGINKMAASAVDKIRKLASDPLMQVRGLSLKLLTGDKPGAVAFIGTRAPMSLARAAAASLGSTLPPIQVGDPPARLNATRTPLGPVDLVLRRGAVGVALGGHDSELVELAGADPLPDPPLFSVHIMLRQLAQYASLMPQATPDPELAQASPELARKLAETKRASLASYSEVTLTGRPTPRGLIITFASRH